MDNITYYWGEPDISVKFCENKYDKYFWIAEYHNTISSIIYLLVGIFYYYTKIRPLSYYLFFMGFSTAVMHGTLRYYGQILDELSIILIFHENIKRLYKKNYTIPLIFNLLMYLRFYQHYYVFLSIFFTYKFLILKKLCFKKKFKQNEEIFIYIYYFYFSLAGICWFIDQKLCNYYSYIEFHALWHYFSGFAIFFAFYSFII
tara:strand:- start:16410 stop:17015 length:606 start_codon:yes stop_codon:yes gene_type:complete